MSKIKVMSVFGTRPEATKMAPLVKKLSECEQIESYVTVTAQHREMLDQVLDIFDLKVDFDLNLMKQSQTISYITAAVLSGMNDVFVKVKPDLVLVHGDTTTSFAASLSAFYNRIKVGHVEAGLRSFNNYEPYPEEMNRRLTGVLADIHFAPTELSKQNLLNENISEDKIFVTGNTAIDCMETTVEQNYEFHEKRFNTLDFNKRIITMTAHRGENLGEPLVNICKAAIEITNMFSDVEIVYAVHKNPKVQEVACKYLSDNPNIHLVDPPDVKDMHNLMKRSFLVLTDSGGLQEEAPSLGKPVIVLRNVTERPEGIKAGTLKLAGTNTASIVEQVSLLLTDKSEYNKMVSAKNPFGDGKASERIVNAILSCKGLFKI